MLYIVADRVDCSTVIFNLTIVWRHYNVFSTGIFNSSVETF